MSYNVPAVTDVLAGAIKEVLCTSSDSQNVAEKNRTKGVSPTAVFCSLAPKGAYSYSPVEVAEKLLSKKNVVK
jgi:hypothetical protein